MAALAKEIGLAEAIILNTRQAGMTEMDMFLIVPDGWTDLTGLAEKQTQSIR